MRETISYDRNKDDIVESVKMKPFSNIKGRVKVELINNDTKEVEREILTENIRMKWLDYQIYMDGLTGATCLWDFLMKYAGQTPSKGKQFEKGGNFINLVLYNSQLETEDEKRSSIDGTLIGYCTMTDSGSGAKKGSFVQSESYIRNDTEGNLVMHNVYDFAAGTANGTITHIGFSKQNETYYYYSSDYEIYGKEWGLTTSLPSTLVPAYSPVTHKSSTNCYMVSKNVFRFTLNIGAVQYLCDLNILTGTVVRKIPLKDVLGANFSNSNCYVAGLQISRDGRFVYMVVHSTYNGSYGSLGTDKVGWNILTFDCETGNCIDHYNVGQLKVGNNTWNYSEYSVGLIDIYGNGNLILFGAGTSNTLNTISEYNVAQRTSATLVKTSSFNDSDSVTSGSDVYRGSLTMDSTGQICYRRDHYYGTEKSHIYWDRELTIVKRNKDVANKMTILMDIIDKDGLAIGTVDSNDSNSFCYWGIFDKRCKFPVTTLTKLPTPVVKNSSFTMRVQYDIIFELPNILDALVTSNV